MSTDLYGMAVLNACEQILERLEPIKKALREKQQLGRYYVVLIHAIIKVLLWQMLPVRLTGKSLC